MKWYELDDKERFNKIYKKYSIKDFFDWWSDSDDEYMEIRFQKFNDGRYCANQLKLHNHKQSVFVNNHEDLTRVIKLMRGMSTMWFGINPRRRLKNKSGKLMFGGKDIFISKNKFLFIDIDRIESDKNGSATKEQLMNANLLADKITSELAEVGFDNQSMRICSGNGVQQLIKLDIPIELPMPKMDEHGDYYESQLFIESKQIIQKGIGKILIKYSKYLKSLFEDFKVEVDKTCFNIGRVGALPYSYNMKFDKAIPRGIVNIKGLNKKETNEGMSDYLYELFNDAKKRAKASKIITKESSLVFREEYKIIHDKLKQNVIINLMLNFKFPNGGINNTLWYGLKILLHNSSISIFDKEYKKIHNRLKSIHNRTFTENGLEKMYINNYNGPIKKSDINIVPIMVNKYLRNNKIVSIKTGKTGYHKPLFPVSPRGKIIHDITVDIEPKLLKIKPTIDVEIEEVKDDPLIDVSNMSDKLFSIRRGDELPDSFLKGEFEYTNAGTVLIKKKLTKLIISFLHKFRSKWGDEVLIYMMKYYMDDYFNHRRF